MRAKILFLQDAPAQLIYYERNDVSSLSIPKLSNYAIAPISHPEELKVSLISLFFLLDYVSINMFSMGIL